MTREQIAESYPESQLQFAEGFDEAILGVDENRWYKGEMEDNDDSKERVVYSISKMIEILMNRDGMTYDEAREFFEFNIAGGYIGVHTPVWCDDEVM